MSYTIEFLADAHCGCGENPFYDGEGRRVLWTDIPRGRLYSLDERTGKWGMFYDGPEVGGFTLQSDGSLLLFRDRNVARFDFESGQIESVIEGIDDPTGRFNDVLSDPEGRVFAGTMGRDGQHSGGLFLVERDGSWRKLWDGTDCANGLGFSPCLKALYWTDSTARSIYLFDYDRDSGELSNRREFFAAEPGMGTPDGLTVDADGDVWSAFYGGACLRRFGPDGQIKETIEMPVPNITSCVFGGPEMSDLFVTTAGGKDGSQSAEGALFRIRTRSSGTPDFRSRIKL
jgi:sugar lactone lactonase YvrE